MLSGNRKKFSAWEKSIGKNMSFLSANSWTALSIIFALLAAYMITQNMLVFGAAFFAITALCDAIDGAVARHTKTSSSKGAYLDTIVDRYVEFFIITGLFFASLPYLWPGAKFWLFAYLFGSVMTTYAKAAAKEKGLIQQEMRFGLMERAERLSFLFLGLLLGAISGIYLIYMIALLAILSNITALQRISKAFSGAK